MTGSHSRLGISDRESRTTGVIRAYDTGVIGNLTSPVYGTPTQNILEPPRQYSSTNRILLTLYESVSHG